MRHHAERHSSKLIARIRTGAAKTKALPTIIRAYLWRVDLFGLRGVPQSYHRGMRAFWFDGLLATTSDAFYANYITLYLLALGATGTQIGWLTSIASLLGMLAPLPGAALTQRMGQRKRMVVIFSVAFRLMLLLAALVPLFVEGQIAVWLVFALFALRVGFINLFAPAWLSLTRDIVPITARGNFLSTRSTLMAMVSLVAVPIAGQMIEWLGAPTGYQVTLGIAFFFGIGASYAFSRIPEPRHQDHSRVGIREQLRSLWHALTANRLFLNFVLLRLLWDFAVQVGGPYFSVYQVQILKSPANVIGLLATVSSFSRMIGLRVWGRLLDRKGARWVTTMASLTIPVLPFIWVAARKPWHIVFASLPGGFLWAGFEIGGFALLLELLGDKDSTQAAAGYTALLSAASIVGPLVGGWVVSQLGYRWDLALSGILRLLTGLLFLWVLRPFRHQQTASASNP